MSIPKSELNSKAKQVVAEELRRRNLHVEIACRGNTKQEDLLVTATGGKSCRVAVRAKQKADWPPCKDILGPCKFVVFVDFENKSADERPDFYILTPENWRNVVKLRLDDLRRRSRGIRIETTDPEEPVFPDQITQKGEEQRGVTVKLDYLPTYKEQWDKILDYFG